MAKGEMLVAMDRANEALALLQDKVTYFENSAVLCDAVGMLLMDQDRGPEAIDMLRRASILAPDDATIREHLAMVLYRFGQFADAAETLVQLLKDDHYAQRADLWLTLGECQIELRRPADARDSFQTATDIEPASAPAWLNLAKAAMTLGDLRRADLSVRRAMELSPDDSEAILLQGYLRLKENRLADALNCFGQASAMDRQDTVSLCMIGYVMQKMSRPGEAVRYYAAALRIKPEDEMAKKLLASVDLRE
jgi:tetratricopeptide (TPR) repeat protein